jgi:hypothetical protein
MSNNNLFRIAGWCALLTVLLTVVSLGIFTASPTSSLAVILTMVGVVVLTPVFYALYVVHRSESAGLSLAGLVLWIAAAVLQIISLANPTNSALYAVAGMAFALPILIFGFLAYRSTRIPRGLAVVVLLTGVVWLIAGAISFNGQTTLAVVTNLVATVVWLVWLVWLWRVLTSQKTETA